MFKFPYGIHWGKDSPSHPPPADSPPGETRARRVILVGLLLSVLLGSDAAWIVAEETATMLLELVEKGAERFYTRTFGLDAYHAQMASAYTYAVIGLATAAWLIRKLSGMIRHACASGYLWWNAFSASARQSWREHLTEIRVWWLAQDWLNKTAIVVGSVLVVLPLMLVISLALGWTVAELL